MTLRGRKSLSVLTGRLLQKVPLWWLQPLESFFLRRSLREGGSPKLIVILALPRGGSTLTYQSLVHGIGSKYLSNLGNLLFQLPYFGAKLSGATCRKHVSHFMSNYGFVPGLCGPAEGEQFWRYWADWGLVEKVATKGAGRTSGKREAYLRQVFSAISSKDAPYLTGYVGHVLVVDAIKRMFPEALFVRVRRHCTSNAMSLLRSRRSMNLDWFSVLPAECKDAAESNEYQQVASQVYWLNRRLHDVTNSERTFCIDYEKLCEDPQGTIRGIAEFCRSHGLSVVLRQELPTRFHYLMADTRSDDEAMAIEAELARLQARFGQI